MFFYLEILLFRYNLIAYTNNLSARHVAVHAITIMLNPKIDFPRFVLANSITTPARMFELLPSIPATNLPLTFPDSPFPL